MELIAAYHAGRLTAEEASAFDSRLASDPAFAAEVASLAPVAAWLQRSFDAGPSANYRLSPDRAAAIRAAARGKIVEFPAQATAPSSARRSRVARFARRYGLAAAAAVAMMFGGISGFESGRLQYAETSQTVLLAIDPSDTEIGANEFESIHYYPPAYGLDHADLGAMASRYSGTGSFSKSVTYAARPHRDYGLPGPGSPYLRSRELLFFQ